MKTFKKLFSIVLAVAMILSMSVTAFAGTGKITILNPGEESYLAYKIFDAEIVDLTTQAPTEPNAQLPEPEKIVKYTIDANSDWLDVVYDTDNKTSNIAGLTFTEIKDTNDTVTGYIVTMGPGFTAENLASVLKNRIPQGVASNAFEFDPDTDSASGLDAGYYLVVASTTTGVVGEEVTTVQERAMLVTVLNGEEAKIQNKNDMPLDKTVNGEKATGVQVGDEVSFAINMKSPSIDPNDTFYAFYLSDKMGEGLYFNEDSFRVTIGSGNTQVLTVGNGLTEVTVANVTLTGDQVRFDENGKTFELSLDMLGRKLQAETDVVVTYTARVTEDAVAKIVENTAVLEYGNNPENLEIKDSKTKVYDSQIIIDKFETDAPERKLAGAKFVLYREETVEGADEPVLKYYKEAYREYESSVINALDEQNPALVENVDYETEIDQDTSEKTYYMLDKNGNRILEIQFVDDKADATEVVTDADGRAKFIGLADGTYYIEETEAPVDYVKLAERVEIKVENGDCITPGLSDDEVAMMLTETASINNTIGTNLPSTGGIGTTIFYVLGAILVIAGGVVLVTRRRMSA